MLTKKSNQESVKFVILELFLEISFYFTQE